MWIRTQSDELIDVTGATIYKDYDHDYLICCTRTSRYDEYHELGAYDSKLKRNIVFNVICSVLEDGGNYVDISDARGEEND